MQSSEGGMKAMAASMFSIGAGSVDYKTATDLMGKGFESKVSQSLVSHAMRRGQVVFLRDEPSRQALGMVILDTTTYPGSLFVPILMTADKDPNKAVHLQLLLSLVFKALIAGNFNRMVFIRSKSLLTPEAVKEFNALAARRKIPVTLKSMGSVKDIFGDKRTIAAGAVFIAAKDRPNLMKDLTSVADVLARDGLRVNTHLGGGIDPVACSGCSEGKEGSKDGGKDKEKEKEKEKDSDAGDMFKVSVELPSFDMGQLVSLYAAIGVQQFDPAAVSKATFAAFAPIV
jgi:hypothetical protein